MRRIDFLKKKWLESGRIEHAARLDHSLAPDVDVFALLFAADPTARKIYAEFILRCYANREFLTEDVDRITETLASFDLNKRRLPEDKRDIGGYASERDVWEMLAAAGVGPEPESGKQAKRSDRNRAHLESEVIHADGWTMALLKTGFAARWWGIGTRWCTTEKTGRVFNDYASRGNLRVLVSPEGVKHQLHIGTGSLCDSTDKPIQMDNYLSTLPEAFLPAVRQDVNAAFSGIGIYDEHTFVYRRTALLSLPRSLFENETIAAFERMKVAGLEKLRHVCSEDGWVLKVSGGDLSSWAIRYDLGQPYDITRDRQTVLGLLETPDGRTVCVDFSRGPSGAIGHILPGMPVAFREAFLAKCIKSWRGGTEEGGRDIDAILRLIPPSELSPLFWKAWAKKVSAHCGRDGEDDFGYIPAEALTVEVAHVFAKAGIKRRIPAELVTDGVAKALAKHDMAFLEEPDVAAALSDRQLANVYGSRNGENVRKMPPEHRTAEMMRLIMAECAGALKQAVCLVRTGTVAMDGVSEEELVREMTMISLSSRPASVSDVTIPLSRDIYLDIVSRCSSMLAWVPLEYRDVELCTAAVSGPQKDGLCHFPAWVVKEIRAAAEGAHGITHNYRASQKYAHILKSLERAESDPPAALTPFKCSAVEPPIYSR